MHDMIASTHPVKSKTEQGQLCGRLFTMDISYGVYRTVLDVLIQVRAMSLVQGCARDAVILMC